MERFKIVCEIMNKIAEVQLDTKKIPGETDPCYMVSIDGLFRGYLRKEKSGTLIQLMNSIFSEDELQRINEQFLKLKVI